MLSAMPRATAVSGERDTDGSANAYAVTRDLDKPSSRGRRGRTSHAPFGHGAQRRLHPGIAAFLQAAQIGLIGGNQDQQRGALGGDIVADVGDRGCPARKVVDCGLQAVVETLFALGQNSGHGLKSICRRKTSAYFQARSICYTHHWRSAWTTVTIDWPQVNRGLPRPTSNREFGDRLQVAHEGRLRLCANGLAFSRSAIRTGVPGAMPTGRRNARPDDGLRIEPGILG